MMPRVSIFDASASAMRVLAFNFDASAIASIWMQILVRVFLRVRVLMSKFFLNVKHNTEI